MTTTQLLAISINRPFLTTEELAAVLGLRPQSIRKRHSQTGSYFGLRPVKGPNGRLMWPDNPIEQLTEGAAQ